MIFSLLSSRSPHSFPFPQRQWKEVRARQTASHSLSIHGKQGAWLPAQGKSRRNTPPQLLWPYLQASASARKPQCSRIRCSMQISRQGRSAICSGPAVPAAPGRSLSTARRAPPRHSSAASSANPEVASPKVAAYSSCSPRLVLPGAAP